MRSTISRSFPPLIECLRRRPDADVPRAFVAAAAAIAALAACAIPARGMPRYSARYEQKCALCHVNPSGGGLRTPYASQYLVPEEIAWSTPEKSLLEGIDPQIAERILIGTDFRTIYTYANEDVPGAVADFFQMQGDIYINFQMDDELSLYYDQGISSSYELFGMWQGLPLTGYVKLGRFIPSYGWKFDDHTMFVRSDLGFFPPTNSDVGVEFGVSPKRFDVQFAVVNGNRGSMSDDNRKFATVLNAVLRGHTGPFGWSAGAAGYWDDGDEANFGTGGTFGYLTWRRITWLAQVDWTLDDPQGVGHTTGFVTSSEATYQVRRGLELLATYDFFDPDFNQESGAKTRWGGGVFVMPRPFLTLQALVRSTTFEAGMDVAGADYWETVIQFHLLY
jgi:hypothetical protein